MGLPEGWTLHNEFPEEHLRVDVAEDGVWVAYGQRDPIVITWEELDAIRPFTEETKPGKFRVAK